MSDGDMSTFEQDTLAIHYYQQHALTESVQFRSDMYRSFGVPRPISGNRITTPEG